MSQSIGEDGNALEEKLVPNYHTVLQAAYDFIVLKISGFDVKNNMIKRAKDFSDKQKGKIGYKDSVVFVAVNEADQCLLQTVLPLKETAGKTQ